jgi:hypothetical protein
MVQCQSTSLEGKACGASVSGSRAQGVLNGRQNKKFKHKTIFCVSQILKYIDKT